jgi:threonine/homoserine/homoserine lactone efflux protein
MHPTLLIFGLVAFIGIATPGPTVLLALTNGSRYGVRASVDGMIGAVLSDFVLVSAVALEFVVMFAYAAAGAQAIRFLSVRRVLWLDRICGGALLALSGSLALYRRQV